MSKAKEAGRLLANNLIENFSDRHVTLIGFSMGTEVVLACIEELIRFNKENILLNITTFGGVAEQAEVDKCIQQSRYPLWWINFKSEKDWAVRYLFWICNLGGRPIGEKGILEVEGHEVENYEVGHIVKGHLEYR